MEEIIIRSMSPSDLEEVHRIEETSHSLPWSRDALAYEVSNNETILKIALFREHIIGYVCLRRILDVTHLLNLVVLPSFRRRGVGMTLLKVAIEELRVVKPDIQSITLEVRESNRAAIRLYQKNGFQVTGKRTGYYQRPPENALLMEVDLGERRAVHE